MDFEWDEHKNKKNKQKHDIDFEEASKIFEDINRVVYPDQRKDYGEKRLIAIGVVFDLIYNVVFTIRNGIIRLISARRANKKERLFYFEHLNKQNNE